MPNEKELDEIAALIRHGSVFAQLTFESRAKVIELYYQRRIALALEHANELKHNLG